ncbi:MAG: N-acyl-D-amino-acid deacylase family protein [Desertimonas sp.]
MSSEAPVVPRTLLRGATVVDGTGGAARRQDVVCADGIVADTGPPGSLSGDEIVDLEGLVLAPGFIDPHTHFDAQVLWDRDLTPSCWHGVTTVVMGNCGFGVAPTRPEHRDTIVRTLEHVEGMSADALRAGIDWSFETFGQYLDGLAADPARLNVAVMLGHTPLRLFVMGDDATEREATSSEIAAMEAVVEEAMLAGAVGFATSRSPNHQGAWGRPVPSRFAAVEEVARLARAANRHGRRIVQLAVGPDLRSPDELAALAAEGGGPVTWTALLADRGQRGSSLERLAATRRASNELWAQIACRPIVTQTTFAEPSTFGMCPSFAEVLARPVADRAGMYRDETWRDRARVELDGRWGHRYGDITIAETERHAGLRDGTSIAELAGARNMHPLDLMLELALDEDLATRFRLVLLNDDTDEIAELLGAEGALLALSDAGAHASQLCDACYTTDLLGHWVRERGALSLERAVWHLTGQPAAVFGFADRGRVAAGWRADLVAFDPTTVRAGPLTRVADLPAHADRLVAPSVGIEHVWVNGVAIRQAGADVPGARPGHVLRPT